MKAVFMGTPDFAVGTLEELIHSRHEVAAVVTQPDKPKGRGKAMQFPPVKEVAVRENIPVYQPRRVRDPEFIKILKEIDPDVIVVVAFGQIIPQEIIDLPKYGCINVHGSILPKYRGAAPIQWAVIDGEKESGVTTMQMDAGLDTGDMLLKTIITLEKLEEGSIVPEKQGESPTPYAKMLTKEMGDLDWKKDAVLLEQLIRGLNPWPSAYTHLNGKTLKIWSAEVEERETKEKPGTVVEVNKKELKVQTGKGILSLKEVQIEGKKRMEIDAFLRGNTVKEGIVLGLTE